MNSLNKKQLEVEKTYFYKGALFIVMNMGCLNNKHYLFAKQNTESIIWRNPPRFPEQFDSVWY